MRSLERKKIYILCDTPGFRDSNGTEIDIANGISIIRAIHLCKSVRPVIMISEKGIGDRGNEIKKYANTITSFIKNFKDVQNKIDEALELLMEAYQMIGNKIPN